MVAAKQAATLDVLSAGRLTLGVGIGWSAEEFAALGVPFARRAQRTAEYVAAMRTLWADDVASFTANSPASTPSGSTPSPSAAAASRSCSAATATPSLARVATFGDGWYGFNLPAAAVAERVESLAEQCKLRNRNPRDLTVAVALSDGTPADLPALAEIGVTELVLVAAPPPDPPAATTWVHDLAAQWGVTPAKTTSPGQRRGQ